jgi:V/A-type H+/Na+-transporting ATPase subunit B
LRFADTFEERFVAQGSDENRTIDQTLDLGWELLSVFPEGELKRIDEKFVKQYYKGRR